MDLHCNHLQDFTCSEKAARPRGHTVWSTPLQCTHQKIWTEREGQSRVSGREWERVAANGGGLPVWGEENVLELRQWGLRCASW